MKFFYSIFLTLNKISLILNRHINFSLKSPAFVYKYLSQHLSSKTKLMNFFAKEEMDVLFPSK
jgi:hypothetical protein